MVTPTNPHFLKPLLPGFDSGITIPLTFYSKHIQGKTNQNTWKLISDASDQTWEVSVDGRRLSEGWKDFATAHNLRIGDLVIFKHEGDMVFHVTPFGPSCCEIQYINEEEDETADVTETAVPGGVSGPGAISFDFSFLAEVTEKNLEEDKLYVGSTSSNALNKQLQEVILVNKKGNPWTASLRFSESEGMYYIRRGWRKFCLDNKCNIGDFVAFNVVGDGKTTPLMCVY